MLYDLHTSFEILDRKLQELLVSKPSFVEAAVLDKVMWTLPSQFFFRFIQGMVSNDGKAAIEVNEWRWGMCYKFYPVLCPQFIT
jgi:hypothetical protein